jgi:hypothetical protein
VAIQPNATDPIAEVLSECPEETAEKMARWSIILCILSTVIMIIAGVPVVGYEIMLITLFATWMFLKLLITIKRQLSQAHFVRREVRARKQKARSILQIPTAPSTSGQSGPPSILSTNSSSPGTASSLPPIHPAVFAISREEVAQTTGSDVSPTFDRPRRRDTEADVE